MLRRYLILACVWLSCGITTHADTSSPNRMLGRQNRFDLSDIPLGRLHDQLQNLAEPARHRAMEWLHRIEFPVEDVHSIHVDPGGGVYYVCECPPELHATVVSEEDSFPWTFSSGPLPVSPFPDALVFHSRPGAPNTIYLDFTGSNITGTAWTNVVGRDPIPALPFSTDSDFSTFSDGEQLVIKRVWQRVAEDFAPYDINVTTERPVTWNNRTAHVLITRNTDANNQPNPASNAGGVAYVNVFGASNFGYYRPAWVYHNNLGNVEANIAEAASHEAGHNFGLTHDGKTDGAEYYSGHGSGAISWGPIMGASYGMNVTQWSKGEYYLANNTQDDLAIIASKTAYRPDDHGASLAAASFLTITSNTLVLATNPENDPANSSKVNKGVIQRNNDVDYWAFTSGDGVIRLTIRPWVSPLGARGGNLDLQAALLDSAGNEVLLSGPANDTFAHIETNVISGVYYLRLEGVGTGSPLSSTPTGYSDYASLGQYFITGVVADATGVIIPPQASLVAASVLEAGATSHTFQIVYTDNVAIQGASLGSGNAVVTGPSSYYQAAEFVSVNQAGDGTPRTATYRIPAPGGLWQQQDNGIYVVWINSNSVFDVEGASVAAGSIGSFTSTVPNIIYFANMNTSPGWTLTPDWQYGVPSGTGGMPSSGATGTNVIGYNLSGNYGNIGSTIRYATTPLIDCSGSDVVLLRFYRWLGVGRNDTAHVQVSTNGTIWTTIWTAPAPMTDRSWQLVQYDISALAARSPSLRIRWGLGTSPPNQFSFGWNLDDVAVLGVSDAFDITPSSANLFAMNVTVAGADVYEFSVTYIDDESGVDILSLGDDNVLVTGNAFTNAATLFGVDDESNGSPRTGFYRIIPPGGTWEKNDNGTYQIHLQEDAIRDVAGNRMPGQTLGTFEVNIVEQETGFGGVLYILEPEIARDQGAQWQIGVGDGTNWINSGQSVGTLNPGLYTISFKPLLAWETPESQFVNIQRGETQTLNAVYGEIRTTNNPTPLWWLVDQGYSNDFDSVVGLTTANGFMLWESYLAGLNPADTGSVFKLNAFGMDETSLSHLKLNWNTVSGRTYSVYWITNMFTAPEPVPSAQRLPWTTNSFDVEFPAADFGAFQIRVEWPIE